MSMKKKIIDISQYQTNIDYSKIANDIDGVLIRIGYRGWGAAGTLCKDNQFEKHIKGAIDNKIPYGFYFFSQAKNKEEGEEEAEYAYNIIKQYNPTYPIYIDVEGSGAPNNSGRADNITVAARTDAIIGFCEKIKDFKLIPGVYSCEYWFNNSIDFDRIKCYSIWCAKYGTNDGTAQSKPNISSYDGWQFTSQYSVDGINTKVDMSYFYKDFEDKKDKPEEDKPKEEKITYKTYYANDTTGVNYRATPNGNLKGTYKYGEAIKVITGSETKSGSYTWVKTDKKYWIAKELLSSTKPITEMPFKKGENYTLTVDLKVRCGAGTNYSQKKYNQLTPDGKKHAFRQTSAVLRKGTIVTVIDIVKKSNKEYWGKIPSGWIALMYNGSKYIK